MFLVVYDVLDLTVSVLWKIQLPVPPTPDACFRAPWQILCCFCDAGAPKQTGFRDWWGVLCPVRVFFWSPSLFAFLVVLPPLPKPEAPIPCVPVFGPAGWV